MFGLHLTYRYLSFSSPPNNVPIPPAPAGIERHFLPTPSGKIELLSCTPPANSPPPASATAPTSPSSISTNTPILFVHGGMGGAHVWTDYMLYLASHGITSYAVSMRGHGHSWYPSYFRMVLFTTRRQLTDDVLAALRYVENKHGEKVLLVGHSSGGGLSQGMLGDTRAKVRGLALLGAVPCFGSMGVYKNWAKADPWFSIRMILHLYHPNSPLSHPALVRRIFFSDAKPEHELLEFWRQGSRYEAFLWPFSMMYNFASPVDILKSIVGGDKGGDRVMVLTGTKDVIMTQDIMRDLGDRYRGAMKQMVRRKKMDDEEEEEAGARVLDGEGGEDSSEAGVRVAWVPGAGHHLQNDVQWEIGAQKLLEFHRQL